MLTPTRILLRIVVAAIAAVGLIKLLKGRHAIWLSPGSFGTVVHHGIEPGEELAPIDLDPVIPHDLDLDPEEDDDDD